MRAVISQSMYFPWVGLLEQLRLADIFIHYDDVQYTRGVFNRVQVKTVHGRKWMTVPLRDRHHGQNIDEIQIDERTDWRSQHRKLLKHAYINAPYCEDMLFLVDEVFSKKLVTLSDISRESIYALARYFDISNGTRFISSTDLGVTGSSSQRLCDLCSSVKAKVYVTGHGARNYLDHELFEKFGISVEYMNYLMCSYPQLHSEFNPYVTSLDLVANCGKEGVNVIRSNSIHWKEFLNESN